MNRKAPRQRHYHEIYAQLLLRKSDEHEVGEFFSREMGVSQHYIARSLHITVYYARRPLAGLVDSYEIASVSVPVSETRFMVMAPGGENPRQEYVPAYRKVGVRVKRTSAAMPAIFSFRERLLAFETNDTLLGRKPSTRWRNAFGSRHFQPHMTLPCAGSGIGRDLFAVGRAFRSAFHVLEFDRFVVRNYPVSRPSTQPKRR